MEADISMYAQLSVAASALVYLTIISNVRAPKLASDETHDTFSASKQS